MYVRYITYIYPLQSAKITVEMPGIPVQEILIMFPYEGMGWWMVFGGLWFVVFWGGLIALIVWGITRFTRRGYNAPRRDPLDIARERYASGEITREEFEQLKKDLS